jgi:hypothetical protein
MFTKYYKALLPKALLAGSFLMSLAPAGLATAAEHSQGDSSPYLIGHWKLNDNFSDFTAGSGSPIPTENTEFVFLNPTNLTLTLEYAFFATNDNDPKKKTIFCGCDRDILQPNGRTRYTMLAEKQGGQFSTDTHHCPTQTDGTMKTIVFTSKIPDPVKIDDALQAGYQIDVFGKGTGRTEAGLLAVAINDETTAEIQEIHNKCIKFIKP